MAPACFRFLFGFRFPDPGAQARILDLQDVEVTLELGYDNVSAFIAMFKRELGVTPGRYRGPAI